ncbi:hypothetical protein [Mariniradius sediminis]|uniref:Uncharacterized protein n=1 Tax=Mariniradius sediminis TaxID=2909237 RepID=A0ABS9BVG7_9BACT|nr:hypothetical protein [Mariniradius sediminis]MCF1750908.1 hypothetical protein [Mariniradius sediminis]
MAFTERQGQPRPVMLNRSLRREASPELRRRFSTIPSDCLVAAPVAHAVVVFY